MEPGREDAVRPDHLALRHVVCTGGEPRHAHNSNTETAVQIAEVTYAAAA